MNSCDFFIKQVYCLGLHFVTRANFKSIGFCLLITFLLRVKTILTRPMRFFSQKVAKNFIFERTPPFPDLPDCQNFVVYSTQLTSIQHVE